MPAACFIIVMRAAELVGVSLDLLVEKALQKNWTL
jgi:hypothetical protein